jgi:hypothetical protein
VSRSPSLPRRRLALALIAVGLGLAGCGGSSSANSSTTSSTPAAAATSSSTPAASQGQMGFEGVPIESGPGIGIPGSQVQNTAEGPVAQGGQCIYWLHTHAPDGVIHIESPTQRIYTLGDFFDEWHQPLSSTQVADAKGRVSAIVDGKPWHGDPRSIPLNPHAVIQLAVGTPAPAFQAMSWSGTQL